MAKIPEVRSESKFWDKLGKFAKRIGCKGVYYALLLYYLLTDPNVPIEQKAIIIGALGYLILPIDLIPDILFPAGYADDVAALSAAIAAVRAYITPAKRNVVRTRHIKNDISPQRNRQRPFRCR